MPSHDIIDNRDEKLVDHINRILQSTEAARFAVGYFFLSGFEAIAEKLAGVRQLRLLIGNVTNRETLEQLAEGRRRLELVADALEAQRYPKQGEASRAVSQTSAELRQDIAHMDQTDEAEALLRDLVRMYEEGRLQVRIYTKGRLHAKAYIFDYGAVYDQNGSPVERLENGIAIVGSSNLTLAGVTHNTELNVVVQGNDNHAALVAWFEALWEEAQDFDAALMHEMRQSWAMAEVRPYDIYMKTLYCLVKHRLEDEDKQEILWDDEINRRLADFQRVAVKQAVSMIHQWGACFVADVVGMGKSFIGAAVINHFRHVGGVKPLIICPAALVEMWERYNYVYDLGAVVLSMGYLRDDPAEETNRLLTDEVYSDRDFVLVDESHNFRYNDTQRYRLLQDYLSTGRQCCFLTATPRNKTAWDVYHQIKLFHPEEITYLPVDPPNLHDYFNLVEHGERKLPDLLRHLLLRRRRNDILKWYGYDSETHERVDPSRFDEYRTGRRRAYVLVGGRHQFFPQRELQTVEYSIEATYQGLYQQIRGYLGSAGTCRVPTAPLNEELTYARYGLWHYVAPEKQRKEPYAGLQRAGANLCGLIRVLLFKRFESSVFAFRETVRRMIRTHEAFVAALDQGIVAAGDKAEDLLHQADQMTEMDLVDALEAEAATGRYSVADFDVDLLKQHIRHDIRLLRQIEALVDPVGPDQDAKLQRLHELLAGEPLSGTKRLIFTQYADTARYLYDELNPEGIHDDIEVIFSGDKSKARVVGRFAPKANPEYRRPAHEAEIMTLVATDVLAEGLNLQDCSILINYDLHWNPVRLIQRFGRIDRIGSEHEVVYGFNFLPETELDKNLGLRQKLARRIAEIHETIGEDAAILDPTEQLNEEAMYAIYEEQGGQLSLFDRPEEEEFLDLNEAEEELRHLRQEDPAEFARIADLPDGIRSAKRDDSAGTFVFCQAGLYQQLFLADAQGSIVSRDLPRALGAIRCQPSTEPQPLPGGYNPVVMRVKEVFAEEVKHREAEREHAVNLRPGQRYVMRELRVLFRQAEDEDLKAQINIMEAAFRGPVATAVNRELNRLKRNTVTGPPLLRALTDLYRLHDLGKRTARDAAKEEGDKVPRIICSEALLR
jgi:superfamily II DNA or RNA helicase